MAPAMKASEMKHHTTPQNCDGQTLVIFANLLASDSLTLRKTKSCGCGGHAHAGGRRQLSDPCVDTNCPRSPTHTPRTSRMSQTLYMALMTLRIAGATLHARACEPGAQRSGQSRTSAHQNQPIAMAFAGVRTP